MNWFARLLLLLGIKSPTPDPPAPAPVPNPEPPDNPWPSDPMAAIARALSAINVRRCLRGVGPVVLDANLCLAANELAIGYGDGSMKPHDGFPDRVRRHGWPYRDCGIRNSGFGNVSEGCGAGMRRPEDVTGLDDSPDPAEGHRRDFEDPRFTHVGISIAANRGVHRQYGGYVYVVEYGAKC